MKKRDLMRTLRAIAKAVGMDLDFVREGANHEIWTFGGERLVIPRHRDINERTARSIIKKAKDVSGDGE